MSKPSRTLAKGTLHGFRHCHGTLGPVCAQAAPFNGITATRAAVLSFVHESSSGTVGSPTPVLDPDSSCADEDTHMDSRRWHVEDAARELVPHEEEQLMSLRECESRILCDEVAEEEECGAQNTVPVPTPVQLGVLPDHSMERTFPMTIVELCSGGHVA
ncbi:hypothetical protein B0H10DRAFT_1960458 [Mycena sp. CBHHK59/15]|nr:hypothetical protein B0H10DRAFT_1960458 [Mycena sp. CBHHK59/15]